MTNMSPKSRRKWLAHIPNNYLKTAIVFATPFSVLFERNRTLNEAIALHHNFMDLFLYDPFNENRKLKERTNETFRDKLSLFELVIDQMMCDSVGRFTDEHENSFDKVSNIIDS